MHCFAFINRKATSKLNFREALDSPFTKIFLGLKLVDVVIVFQNRSDSLKTLRLTVVLLSVSTCSSAVTKHIKVVS